LRGREPGDGRGTVVEWRRGPAVRGEPAAVRPQPSRRGMAGLSTGCARLPGSCGAGCLVWER
jgi:hypothetical protein